MRVGYARVSYADMELGGQLALLADCERIFVDKLGGWDVTRPALRECLDFVREGDALVCTRLDRLARSVLHLCTIADLLQCKHVSLVVTEQAIDTSTPVGLLLFHVLAAIAQFERTIIKERQREGIENAKRKGVRFGRKRALSPDQVREMVARFRAGEAPAALALAYHVSYATIYKYIKLAA